MENSLFQNPSLYENQYHTLTKDIRFYTKLAQQTGGPALELGIGTGRIAHSILKKGIPLSGIDVSEKMLESARKNLKEFSGILKLQHTGFLDFKFEEKFSLIFSGFNSLHHLNSIGDLEKLLAKISKHLTPNGIFVFDLLNPQSHLLENQHQPILREQFFDERNSMSCEIWETSQYDSSTYIKQYQWEYRWNNGEKLTETLTHYYFFPEEIQNAVTHSNFSLNSLFGDFNQNEFSPVSPKQIYILRPKN